MNGIGQQPNRTDYGGQRGQKEGKAMSTTTAKFEPTHEISYREPPDAEPEVWFVSLRQDGTAVDVDGHTKWRLDELGRWIYTTRDIQLRNWPHGKLTVINLRKPKKIKKGQEPKHMPAGTIITLARREDGSWQGRCSFNGIVCVRESKGLMGLTSALCRAWLKEAGIVTAKPSEADNG